MENNNVPETITISVSGTKFEVSSKTWSSLTKNVQGKLKTDITRVDDSHYFMEGHSGAFQAILYHYQGEELHIPSGICPSSFKKEMEFWGLEETALAKCCYQRFVTFFDDQGVLKVSCTIHLSFRLHQTYNYNTTGMCDSWL